MTIEHVPKDDNESDLQSIVGEYVAPRPVTPLDIVMIQHRINMLAATAPAGHEVNVHQVAEHYFSDTQTD